MKISKRISRKIKKAAVTVTVIANTLALNLTAFAAETGVPEGVDTADYDSLLDIIFWAVGILIAACACIPGFKKMAEGQANEDQRGFNAGLTAVIAGVVCGAACIAIRTFLF